MSIANQEELLKTKDYLDDNGLNNYMFYEPDYSMGYTAICAGPVYGEQRKLLKRFKLWKQN